MKHIKKALSYSIAGSLGLTVIAGLQGCGNQAPPHPQSQQQSGEQQQQNFFIVVEQTGSNPDTYKLIEKHPTDGPTRAILRDQNGTERFLSEAELKKIAEAEAKKVEDGSSRLAQEGGMQSGGLSLGELILATAAGSLIGGMLANSLMRNKNFQSNQQRHGGGKPATSISRPKSNTASSSKAKPRSGFFGGSKSRSSSTRFGGFGG